MRIVPLAAVLALFAGVLIPSAAVAAPPEPGDLWGAVAVSATHTWAVGSRTAADGAPEPIAQLHSGGAWHEVAMPHPGASADLRAVDATGADDVWAVGNGSPAKGAATLPYADHWNGHTWMSQRLPAPAPSASFVYGVAENAPDDVWAVGTGPDGVIEHRDAAGWSVAATGPAQSAFYGVTAASADAAWAVGDRRVASGASNPFVERWNGRRWSVESVPMPAGAVGGLFWGATATSAHDVWVVGRYDLATGRERTLVEHWDGTSWTIVASPSPGSGAGAFSQLYAVSATGPDDAEAVGSYYDGAARTNYALREHWNGTRWRVVPGPTSSTEILTAVAAGSPMHADAVGSSFALSADHMVRETWNGSTWRRS